MVFQWFLMAFEPRYALEYTMWVYVRGMDVLRDKMLVIDLLIILCGVAPRLKTAPLRVALA